MVPHISKMTINNKILEIENNKISQAKIKLGTPKRGMLLILNRLMS